MSVKPKFIEPTFATSEATPVLVQPKVTTPVLEARGITVTLGQRKIIRDIDLSIAPNEIMAIIGPSGCGKSTFITTLNRMIHHTLPAASVEGDILLNGVSVFPSEVSPTALRGKIAMVFQRPNPFPFSVRKNLEFALKAAGDYDRATYDGKIQDVLESVNLWRGLKDRLKDDATNLSGGEQQRLCIARALLSNPEVILFDEPCSALDPISSTAVEELIGELKKRCAIAIVTHNLAQARRVSDRCACFWIRDGSGQVIETGETPRVMSNPHDDVTRAYINGEFC